MNSNVIQASFSRQTPKPTKPTNKESGRTREYLEKHEIEKLIAAVADNRHAQRDKLMITMMYRHGLRVSELIDLKWDAVNFPAARIHINRAKRGEPSKQPIDGDELRALRHVKAAYPDSHFIFVTPTATGPSPLTSNGVFKIIRRAGESCGLPLVHPHMLRHSCGHRLANAGTDTRAIQDYLGHKNIQHTVVYTKLAENRFKGLEKLF